MMGLNTLKLFLKFEDENTEKFKTEFLKYVKEYWIEGCYPPQVWLNFQRSGDETNNNQEGMNSRINKELKQTNPSPGILLCFIYKQLRCAETQRAEASVGQTKPRQKLKIKKIAQRRYTLKVQYKFERKLPGADQGQLLQSYLSDMSQNVTSATLKGLKKYDTKKSQSKVQTIEQEGEGNISTWNTS